MTKSNPSAAEPLSLDSIFTAQTLAPVTRYSYEYAWKKFSSWCGQRQLECLPASFETTAGYVTELLNRGRKVATIERYLCGISHEHRNTRHPSPYNAEIRALVSGARRIVGTAITQKAPIHIEQLRKIYSIRPKSLLEIRDRAVMLFGFGSALRRQNIVALDLAHVAIQSEGAIVEITREKQDQNGEGRKIGIPRKPDSGICPVEALEHWLTHRGDESGPLFTRVYRRRGITMMRLDPDRIAQIVKREVAKIGLDTKAFAAHSLRSGCITAMFEQGIGEILIGRHSGHRSLANLRRYLRSRDPFKANAWDALKL